MPMSVFGGCFSSLELVTGYFAVHIPNAYSTAEINWLSESEEHWSYLESLHFLCLLLLNLCFLLDCVYAGASQKERGVWQGEGPPTLDS